MVGFNIKACEGGNDLLAIISFCVKLGQGILLSIHKMVKGRKLHTEYVSKSIAATGICA